MDFLLLGPMEARIGGLRVNLGRRSERRLLGLLLLQPGRTVSFDRLLELLWNGEPPGSARATVHTYVARLRAALQPHDVRLHTRGDGYLVDVAPEQVDVHRFVSAAMRGQQVSDPAERAAALAEALALWRGPLMADVADNRLRDRVGASLDESRLTTVELMANAQLACGRYHQVVADLIDPVTQHPTRERLVELLMIALYRCGRQTDALKLYRDARGLLRRDFGIDPGPRLDALHRQVLANDPALDPPSIPTPGRTPATQAGRGPEG
jgi:SARP family transcriptional regulator, regulator of embCAB operon